MRSLAFLAAVAIVVTVIAVRPTFLLHGISKTCVVANNMMHDARSRLTTMVKCP